jgi:hypothetical protein
LNGYRFDRSVVASLVIAGGLLLLTGCQGLMGGGNAAGTVGVGTATLDFGTVVIGSTKTLSDTITNNTASAVTISSTQVANPEFKVTGVALPMTLAAGQTASFNVAFTPTDSGDPDITISFDSPNAQPMASLTATGIGATIGKLSPSPSPVGFGNTQVGGNKTITVSLSNSGGVDVTVSQATLSGAGFTMSNLALPFTLHAAKAVSATITFAPTGTGVFNGSVTFVTTSNQQNSNVVLDLSGDGVASGTVTPNPASLAFGNVQVGSSSTKAETLTNTGGASLTISQATPSGAGFSINGLTLPVTLAVNQSVTINTVFAPTTGGAVTGSLSIVSDGSNSPLGIPLSGTGLTPGTLAANPTSLSFGNVQVGNTGSLSETVTNTGGSSVTITQANVTGAAFSIPGLNLPITLTANQSVTFTAKFAPTGAGAVSGNLSVVSDASNSPLNVALSGTGTAAGTLAVSPTSLSFGNVTVGSSSALNGSLTASGASVTINSASFTNNEFALSGITLPKTLAAGQSTTFTVMFTPTASGATSATLSFTSNASNSPTAQTMTGTGTAAIQHTVNLTWTASTGAVGYNVYRGTGSGGPYAMINSSLDGTTTYVDNTVASGQTYYYVATAVDGSGSESAYSNQAQAVVPNP